MMKDEELRMYTMWAFKHSYAYVSDCSSQGKHSPYHSSFECAILNAFIPQNPDVTFRLFCKLLDRIQVRRLS